MADKMVVMKVESLVEKMDKNWVDWMVEQWVVQKGEQMVVWLVVCLVEKLVE